ncbi:hypothetical protein R3P38DRAFT_3264439 [Favolaschia claudopus]|uniref:F-box domain-containing protein n=1 Tax=Favolaschia claudopus TaxID=2862362 RepID=A0AAW0C5M5_9AGAR
MATALYDIFLHPELSFLVFRHLPFRDLVTLSHGGPETRSMFRAYMNSRFQQAVSRFIDPSFRHQFCATLRNSSAVIVGSVAAAFIHDKQADRPSNMNMLTRKGTMSMWAALLCAVGAEGVEANPSKRLKPFLLEFRRYRVNSFHDTPLYITVGEVVDESVLPAVFYSKTTAQMTMLTCDRVTVPYKISLAAQCETGLHADENESWFVNGYRPFLPCDDLLPCGQACRYITRNSSNFDGFTEAEWNIVSDPHWEVARASGVEWRLGNEKSHLLPRNPTMASFPNEVIQNIVLVSMAAQDVEEREENSRWKGCMARVNRDWGIVVYGTGELWDTLFVHSCMSMRHIMHICRRAAANERPSHLRFSSETEEEPGAENLVGLDTVTDVARWATRIGGHLAPIVLKANSIRVDSMSPGAIFDILGNVGAQQAMDLEDLRCYATVQTAAHDDFNYLQQVQSLRLRSLAVSRVNLVRFPTTQLQTIRTLRLFALFDALAWHQLRTLLLGCIALEELDVDSIRCTGDRGSTNLTLLTVCQLSLDLSTVGGAELAKILDLPRLRTLTLRGEDESPWEEFALDFNPMLRIIKRCTLCAENFTEALASVFHQLHSVNTVDVRPGGSDFLLSLTLGFIEPPTGMRRLQQWIVSGNVAYRQAAFLFDWPGSIVQVVYESREDEREGSFVEWRRRNRGFVVDLVHADP